MTQAVIIILPIIIILLLIIIIVIYFDDKYITYILSFVSSVLLFAVFYNHFQYKQLLNKTVKGGNVNNISVLKKEINELENKKNFVLKPVEAKQKLVNYIRSKRIGGKTSTLFPEKFSDAEMTKIINKGVEAVKTEYSLSSGHMSSFDDSDEERLEYLSNINNYMNMIKYGKSYLDKDIIIKQNQISKIYENEVNKLSNENAILENKVGEIVVLEEQTKKLEAEFGKCQKEKSEENEKLTKEISELNKKIKSIQSESEEMKKSLTLASESKLEEQEKKCQNEKQILDSELSQMNQNLLDSEDIKLNLTNELDILTEKYNNLNDELEKLKELSKDNTVEFELLKKSQAICSKDLITKKSQLTEAENTISTKLKEITELQKLVNIKNLENYNLSTQIKKNEATQLILDDKEVEIKELQTNLEECEKKLKSCLTTKDELKINIKKREEELSIILAQIKNINTNINLENEEILQIEQDLLKNKEYIIKNETINGETKDLIIKMKEGIVELQKNNSILKNDLLNNKISLAEFKEKDIQNQEQLTNKNNELSNLTTSLKISEDELRKSIDRNNKYNEELTNKINLIKSLKNTLMNEKIRYEKEYKLLDEETTKYKSECENQKNTLNKKIEEHLDNILVLSGENKKVNTQLELTKVDLKNTKDDLKKTIDDLDLTNILLEEKNIELNKKNVELQKVQEDLYTEKKVISFPEIIYVEKKKDNIIKNVKPIIVKTESDKEFEEKMMSLNIKI